MRSTDSSGGVRAARGGGTRRHLALSAVVTLLLTMAGVVGLSVATVAPAAASHYRANGLSWHAGDEPNSVEFHLTGSWRCDYFTGSCDYSVGDLLGAFATTSFDFGDDGFAEPGWVVTSVDQANNVVSAEAHLEHTYAGPGPWVASLNDCCRLSPSDGHMNNGDGEIRFETLVDLARDTSAPVALVAPIVDCALETTCSFTVPAVDTNGQPLRWRMSTADEAGSGFFNQPPGASINATTGLYTWDTTGAQLAADGSTYYSTQVMIENVVGGDVVSRTPVDFFIRLGSGSTNAQPVFDAPTPADGATVSGTVGQPMTFQVAASDPDTGDTVTPAMLGLPNGATFTVTPGNPATATFTWTPTAAGDTIVTLTAQDQAGLGAVPRGLTLHVEEGEEPEPEPDPLTVDAGSNTTGTEGSPVTLDGTVGGGAGSASTTWSATPGAGVDAGATCSFGDAAAVDTTVTCTDDGTWTLTLSASEGSDPVVTDTAELVLDNAKPSVSISSPGGSATTTTPVSLTAPFSDAGSNDTHTCTIDWGDGSTEAGTVAAGRCTGSHTYGTAGSRTLVVTVTDDDGGAGTASRSITVTTPKPPVVENKVWGKGMFKCPGKTWFDLWAKSKGSWVDGDFDLRTWWGKKFHSKKVTYLKVVGNNAYLSGTGYWNGKYGYTFAVWLEDRTSGHKHGHKKKPDTIRVVIKTSKGHTVFSEHSSLHTGDIWVK